MYVAPNHANKYIITEWKSEESHPLKVNDWQIMHANRKIPAMQSLQREAIP